MSSFSEASNVTEKEQADLLKEEGNVFFKAFNYNKAIEKYSAAIAIHPDAVYYSNRAQCHIKNEDFGLAIADATEAIRYCYTLYRILVNSLTSNPNLIQQRG
jgi:tetratricopeptide (TPR) repeat protein